MFLKSVLILANQEARRYWLGEKRESAGAKYGILRIEKVKMFAVGEIAGRGRDISREYLPGHTPGNIYEEKSKYNESFGAGSVKEILSRVSELQAKTTHRPHENAVGLLEVMITMTENGVPIKQVPVFLDTSRRFVEGLYGAENVVSVFYHFDEKVPHLHALLVPLETKERYRKQTAEQRTAGIRETQTVTVLNAQKYMADRQTLTRLQDKFFDEVSSRFGLERGEPAAETHRRHEKASIRKEAERLRKEAADREAALSADEQRLTAEKAKFDHARHSQFSGLPSPNFMELPKTYQKRIENAVLGYLAGAKEKHQAEISQLKKTNQSLIADNKKLLETLTQARERIGELTKFQNDVLTASPAKIHAIADIRQKELDAQAAKKIQQKQQSSGYER
jgi:hypothetical protein